MNVLENFLRYVKVHTTSDEESPTRPSSLIQLDLANILVEDLKRLGLNDAHISNGCVYAHLKSNCGSKERIGFIAHMDTSPEASGKDVNPQVITNYDGDTIKLAAGVEINPVDFPSLSSQKGHTLITSDGSTLLGADDKAGVAEIIGMLEYFYDNPDIQHHNLCIAFTPDEEVGRGTEEFDLKEFDAEYAYTVDGGKYDEFSYECFNAASAKIEITGVGIHPGEAKDKMVNAARIAIEFDTLLPDKMRPEHTDGYEGFNHLTGISGDEVFAKMGYIIRSFDLNELENLKNTFISIKDKLSSKYPKASINLTITDSYKNMRYELDKHMDVIDKALNAMKCEGVEPIISPIRGGTDGARLTSIGLPTPNMPTGGYNFHGIREYASYNEMITCTKYLINIAKI